MNATTDTTNRTYLAVCPSRQRWARGTSVDDAKAALKAVGGTLNNVVVYKLPPYAYDGWVDNWGSLNWSVTDPDLYTHADPEVVYKRGV